MTAITVACCLTLCATFVGAIIDLLLLIDLRAAAQCHDDEPADGASATLLPGAREGSWTSLPFAMEGVRVMSSCVERYMRGCMTDDLDMILNACADDFVYGDPIDGRFAKAEFADYFRGWGEAEVSWSDAVRETDGEETFWTWCTWKPKGATESSLGAAMVKAGRCPLREGRLLQALIRTPADCVILEDRRRQASSPGVMPRRARARVTRPATDAAPPGPPPRLVVGCEARRQPFWARLCACSASRGSSRGAALSEREGRSPAHAHQADDGKQACDPQQQAEQGSEDQPSDGVEVS